MIVPQYRQIKSGEQMSDISDYLNSFLRSTSICLTKGINEENLDVQYKELTFTTDAAYTSGTWTIIRIPWETKTKPKSVIIAQINQTDDTIEAATSVTWMHDGNEVLINFIAGLANSKIYNLRLRIE